MSRKTCSAASRPAVCHGGQRGFMLAPLLYMLALGGIGAAVMFSGYSQVLRSNAEMTAINTVRQQLNSAGQTLSASAGLDSATSTIVQPPNVQSFSAVTDTARLPGNYAAVNATGTPHSYGVVDVNTGVRQLDPWGKYYIYCRWENPVSNASAPSIMVISGGPDGLLSTKCGDTAAEGDDRLNKLTVAEAINRANVWQVNSSSQVKFGIQADAVKVNDDGSMEAKSLTLATPLAITSGGTGAIDAVGARTNLSVPSNTGNGASGLWNIDISGNAATATALLTPRNVSIAGSSGLVASAIAFDGTADVALALGGTLAIANGGTGATTAGGARTNLGSTAIGDALFTTANAAAARTTLGATATGTALFTATDAAAARTTLGLGSMAIQNADNVAITGGTISGADLTGSTMPGSGVTGSVGSADTVPASGITGIVSLAQGGTGVAASSNANLRNLIGTDNASNLLSGTLSEARLPLINPSPAGTYGWGTIDAYGRVLEAREIAANAITQGNSGVSVSDTGSDGTVTITTEGLARLTVGPTGNVGIGTATPADKLDVNGSMRIRGAAATDRSLIYSTLGLNRWALTENNVAEGGSDAGSNFVVTRYSDAGTAIGNALAISRATGAISTSGDMTIGGAATATGGFYGSFNGTFTGTVVGGVAVAGTNGQVQFNNAGSLGADGAFHWDNSTKRLGIGTNGPTSPIDVVSGLITVRGASSGFNFGGRDGGAGFQWYANLGNASLWDNTNSVSRIFVAPGGNVGIGATSPLTTLDVRGTITAGNASSTSGTILMQGYYSSGALATFATEYSSGAPIIGYGVTPSTSALASFLSSTPIALGRSAITANSNITFYTGATQTVATGSAATMAPVMTILNSGNVGIGTTAPAASSLLDLSSNTKGMLPPRMTTAQKTAISSPAAGLTVYDSTLNQLAVYNGTAWGAVGGGAGALSALTDVALTSTANNDILRYDSTASKWKNVNIGTAMTTTTMVPNLPDAIRCAYNAGGSTVAMFQYAVGPDGSSTYMAVYGAAYYYLTFDASGNYVSNTALFDGTAYDCVGPSITQHYAAGRAFNFIGSSLASAAAPAGGVQFNNGSGALAGDTALVWDNTSKALGIGTASPSSKAVLDLTSTTKGFLPPRMTTAQRDAIAAPSTGLIVYNTTNAALEMFNGTSWTSVGSALPNGAIAAFASASCPSGWSEYTPARGRFLRGIDNGVGLDAGGTRAPGHQQTDATAINGLSATTNASLNILSPQPNTGGAHDLSRGPSAGSVTLASTDPETRPYNVAVTFCQYNGSGGGGGATALVALSDVAISGATNGQVLTYDSTAGKWINQAGGGTSQWTNGAASAIYYTGGNVGIGTTAPDNKLTVASGGIGLTYATATNTGGVGLGPDTSSGSYNFAYTNSQGTYLTRHYGMTILPNASPEVYLAGYGGLGLIAGGANRLHITTAGNVGIGTTAPATALDVRGTSNGMIIAGTSANYMTYGFDGANFIATPSGSGNMIFGYNSGAGRTIAFYSAGTITPQLSILASGNVGIGATTPVSRLNVTDGANPYTAGTGELLQLKRSTTNSAASGAATITIGNASNLFRIAYGGTSDRLGFVDGGNVEAMSILNGGNVGIGTTAPNASALLDVSSTTKGFLPPRMTTAQVTAVATPADGLMVYDTDTDTLKLRANGAWGALGAGGGGTLATLTDTNITSPANNSLLRYDGGTSKWIDVELQDGLGATTMVAGWPDALECNVTNPGNSGDRIFTLAYSPHTSGSYIYRAVTNPAEQNYMQIAYNSDGSYSSFTTSLGAATSDCNSKSIANLYSEGKAFNFIGGGSPWTKAGTVAHYMAGNVGIGTTSPSSLLHVRHPSGNLTTRFEGVANTTSSKLYISSVSSGDGGMMYDANSNLMNIFSYGDLRFNIGTANISGAMGNERMVIAQSGNVGIGTTNPGQNLTIDGASPPISEIRSGGYLMLRPTGNSWDMRLQATGNQLDVLSGGAVGSPIMSLLHGGNVGIGTTNPGKKLEVDTASTTGTNFLIKIGGGTHLPGAAFGIGFDPEGVNYPNRVKTAIVVEGNGSGWSVGDLHILQKSTLDANEATLSNAVVTVKNATGNVGIGTTTPSTTLQVNGTATATLFSGSGASLTALNASNLASGTVPTARLGSGTANSTTYLRGDNTWATPSGGGSGSNYQSFTASGTWTKPGSGNVAMIECWGGGGSGGRYYGSGGGGGGYNSRTIALAALPASVTVTVGAGGAAKAVNGNGNVGGNTTFGSYLTAYGGGGGAGNAAPGGGGGGGQLSAGATASASCIGSSGSPKIATGAGAFTCGYATCYESIYMGQGGGCTVGGSSGYSTAQSGITHGGGGGSYYSGDSGASSVYGGGGGGAWPVTAGGTSSFGGNGGAAASGTATNGAQPGGGGGASQSGTSGAGGAGQCNVIVW
ncbi:MAG: glycine-rich domain-containing protein [Hyphomicrobiaceae bacterium]